MSASVLHSLTAAQVGDDAANRTVYGVVVALLALGVVFIVLAVWITRQTRPDRALLAPLEELQTRRWRRLDPQARRRALDEVRPEGAEPLEPAPGEPDVVSDFESLRPVRGFADLADPLLTGVGPVDEPAPAPEPRRAGWVASTRPVPSGGDDDKSDEQHDDGDEALMPGEGLLRRRPPSSPS